MVQVQIGRIAIPLRSICSEGDAERRNGEARGLPTAETVAFLEEVRRWRQQCDLVLTRANPQGLLYNATSKLIGAALCSASLPAN